MEELEQNNSNIIRFLVDHGMKWQLSNNPDAVERILAVAQSKLNEEAFDISKSEHVQALSGIIDEQGRIKDSSREEEIYDKETNKDGDEFFSKKTIERETIIDVDAFKRETILSERLVKTDGYGYRNPNPSKMAGEDAVQFPYGAKIGDQRETVRRTTIILGEEAQCLVVHHKRQFVIPDNNTINPNLDKGEYMREYDGDKISELRAYGICAEGTAHVIEDGGKYIRLTREYYRSNNAIEEQGVGDGDKKVASPNKKMVTLNGKTLSEYISSESKDSSNRWSDVNKKYKDDGSQEFDDI